MAKANEDKVLKKTVGTPGIVLQRREPYEQSSGFLLPPKDMALGRYRLIAQNDPTVAACLEFVNQSALSRLGEYTHFNAEIQEFIRLNFEWLEGSFFDTCKDLLSCLWAGFAVAEIVTVVRGGRVWLHSLPLIPCESVVFHICEDEDSLNYGRVDEVIQNPYRQNEARLPVDKCLIIRNSYSGGLSNDPYGSSRLSVIHDAWERKQRALVDWSEVVAKYAAPMVKYKLEDTETLVKNEVTGENEKAYKVAAKQLETWSNKNNGFIYGDGNDLDFIFPPTISNSFLDFVQYLDRVIMRGLLIPSLLFDSTGAGSYSLGQEHMNLYQQGLTALLSGVTQAIIEQLVRPLIEVNFGEQDDYGYFRIKESVLEQHEWAKLLNQIKETGAISAENIHDLNYMRMKLGLEPVSSVEELGVLTDESSAEEETIQKEETL